MSDTDSFIEEVTEEVRRDRLYGYVRRFGWIAVVVVLGAVGGTAWLEYRKATDAAAAQELGDRVLAASNQADPAARAAALAEVSGDAGAAGVVIDLRRAGELVAAGDTDAALAVYDGIAKASSDPVYKDLAALKALILRGGEVATDRDAALAELAAPGRPYRPLAMEQQALAAIQAGDTEGAQALLEELLQDSQATDALRQRAGQLMIAVGGELPSTPQLLSLQ